jgi:hypothetical protein
MALGAKGAKGWSELRLSGVTAGGSFIRVKLRDWLF